MLENKVGMIFGVANKRSIAWACAAACSEHGAKLAFTYQGERLKENVEKLSADLHDSLVVPCDVKNQAEVDAAFEPRIAAEVRVALAVELTGRARVRSRAVRSAAGPGRGSCHENEPPRRKSSLGSGSVAHAGLPRTILLHEARVRSRPRAHGALDLPFEPRRKLGTIR